MELTDYNFESGSKVRLFYKNGRQILVSRSELAKHLAPIDAERVRSAFRMRQAYFRELPKWVKVLAISALVLGLGIEGVKAAPGIQRVLHTIIPAIPAPVEAPTSSQTPSIKPSVKSDAQTPVTTPPAQQAATEKTLPDQASERAHTVLEIVRLRQAQRPAANANAALRSLVHGPVWAP